MTKLIRVLAVSLPLASFACDSGGGGETSDPRTDAVLMLPGDTTAGMTVFTQVCGTAACHGPDGNTPGTPTTKMLSEVVPMKDDRGIVDTILKGKGAMPTQSHLNDQQIADVLAYVTETF